MGLSGLETRKAVLLCGMNNTKFGAIFKI